MRSHLPAEVLFEKKASEPNKHGVFPIWQVRKSHYDGKVYCTCPGWIFQARQHTGICKHIQAYLDSLKALNPADTTVIQVYTESEYRNVLEILRETPDLTLIKDKGTMIKIDRDI